MNANPDNSNSSEVRSLVSLDVSAIKSLLESPELSKMRQDGAWSFGEILLDLICSACESAARGEGPVVIGSLSKSAQRWGLSRSACQRVYHKSVLLGVSRYTDETTGVSTLSLANLISCGEGVGVSDTHIAIPVSSSTYYYTLNKYNRSSRTVYKDTYIQSYIYKNTKAKKRADTPKRYTPSDTVIASKISSLPTTLDTPPRYTPAIQEDRKLEQCPPLSPMNCWMEVGRWEKLVARLGSKANAFYLAAKWDEWISDAQSPKAKKAAKTRACCYRSLLKWHERELSNGKLFWGVKGPEGQPEGYYPRQIVKTWERETR